MKSSVPASPPVQSNGHFSVNVSCSHPFKETTPPADAETQQPQQEILCATDFSSSATDAANVAAALASSWKDRLRLVYSAGEWLGSPDVPVAIPLDEIIRQPLDDEAHRVRQLCADVVPDLRHGSAGFEVPLAVDETTRLIVTGSTGRGAAGRWLLGSTAERIAENASHPTLVVRQAQPLLEWLRQGKPLRVLCAVDFTLSADAAIAVVRALAKIGGEIFLDAAYIARPDDVHLMNMTDHAVSDTGANKEDVSNLERDVWERLHLALGDMPTEVLIRVTNGNLAHEFVRLADEFHADLLVVGTHQKHGLRRLMDPSFSRGVLAHAASNVLCVPLASYKPETKIPSIRRVLVATDLTETGNNALIHALSMTPPGGAIKIVHICKAPSPMVNPLIASQMSFDRGLETARHKREAEEAISKLIPSQLATSGVSTTTEVLVHSSVPEGICEEAERFHADVICMAANVPARAVAAILGSMLNSVITHTHVPVFVVTPPKA